MGDHHKLTKYAHFLALSHPYNVESLVELYLSQIHKLHGAPEVNVSDRDVVFHSAFWKEFLKLLGTRLNMSTTHHPQSDGQTARLNRCLETYLRCMIHNTPMKWLQWLHLAEWWYNSCFHHNIKTSPFEVLYGYPPPQLSLGAYLQSSQIAAQAFIQNIQHMVNTLKDNMLLDQNIMKLYAHTHRSERSFEVGDWVYSGCNPSNLAIPYSNGRPSFPSSTLAHFRYQIEQDQWRTSLTFQLTPRCTMPSTYLYRRRSTKPAQIRF